MMDFDLILLFYLGSKQRFPISIFFNTDIGLLFFFPPF